MKLKDIVLSIVEDRKLNRNKLNEAHAGYSNDDTRWASKYWSNQFNTNSICG